LHDVAKLVNIKQEDLAKFGYRPNMKVNLKANPFIFWLPAGSWNPVVEI
jgi:hypothetical protein